MRRVCYLAHQFPVITETFTLKEVDGLAAAGCDVRVAALRPAPAGLPPELARRAAVPLPAGPGQAAAAALGVLRRPGLAPGLLRSAGARRALALVRGAGLARTLNPVRDHVHAQFPLEAASAGLFATLLSGCSFSFSGHTLHQLDLMPEKLAAAAFVTVGSAFERDLLCGRYGEQWRGRIAVSRLGVPPRPSRDAGAVEPGLIASVGTLAEKKGHDVLVRAVAELLRRGRDVRLEVIGEGPQRPQLEALVAELGLEGRVRLPGVRPHAEALALMARAGVFALACVITAAGDHDCLPVALMDAMSQGVPCVSSAILGIPELIEDGATGLLAPAGAVAAAADRIERLLDDPEAAARIGAAGRDSVRERYDLDRNVAALAALFRERLA